MERKYNFKNYRGQHKLRKTLNPKEARKEREKKNGYRQDKQKA